MIATLAALPTLGGAGEAQPAQLRLAEVLPDPEGNATEAEAEWTEIEVTGGGQLSGWALTDFDGALDFTFPSAEVAEGDRLVVANGHSTPGGVADGARMFFANKSWWTFDNPGDEVALVTPGGAVADALRWGAGQALDLTEPAQSAQGPVLPGASVGRRDGAVAWLHPTPGGPNLVLDRAADATVRLAGLVGAPGALASAFCAAEGHSFDPYLWTVAWAAHSVLLGDERLAPGRCLLAGAALESVPRDAVGASLGANLSYGAPFATASWNATTRVDLLDPWGTAALSFFPPVEDAPQGRGPRAWTACSCLGGWASAALSPFPPAPSFRGLEDLRVVRAGPELEGAAVALIENAASTVVLNAYLLTASSIRGALSDAARKGVFTRVLLESAPVGGISDANALSAKAVEQWNSSGVWVKAFATAPPNPARDHAKYAVADGHSFLVATENFVGAALSADDPNTGYALLGNSTPLSKDLTEVFDWDFALGADRTAPGRLAAGDLPIAAHAFTEGGPRAAVLASPEAGESSWVEVIDNASLRLDFALLSADMATAGPTGSIGRALLRACAKGAAIHGLLAGAFASTDTNENLAVARALVAAAAVLPCAGRFDLRIDARPSASTSVLHAKVLVADGLQAILGSHNWVRAAFASNREVSLWVESKDAAGSLEGMLELDFARADPVEAAPLSLSGDGRLGAAPTLEVRGGASPTYAALALGGTGAMVIVLFGARRRRRPGRPAGPPTLIDASVVPREGPSTPFDPIQRAALEELPPLAPPAREAFNPRADPPSASPRPDLRAATLPANAFELFEKG